MSLSSITVLLCSTQSNSLNKLLKTSDPAKMALMQLQDGIQRSRSLNTREIQIYDQKALKLCA
jgi:hypothetical protein